MPVRALQTAKIGSLVDVQDSEDPEGLRVMYYLVQDLKVSRPAASFIPIDCQRRAVKMY
jgi:hypothetical protein